RAGIAAGADAVMTAHIEIPALDPAPSTPTTLSAPIVGGLLRTELGFRGLVYTDSMGMAGVTSVHKPREAALLALKPGNDLGLHARGEAAAIAAIRDAVKSGDIAESRIDDSVARILAAKARVGLHRAREVNLAAIPGILGTRAHQAVADEVSQRSITL